MRPVEPEQSWVILVGSWIVVLEAPFPKNSENTAPESEALVLTAQLPRCPFSDGFTSLGGLAAAKFVGLQRSGS